MVLWWWWGSGIIAQAQDPHLPPYPHNHATPDQKHPYILPLKPSPASKSTLELTLTMTSEQKTKNCYGQRDPWWSPSQKLDFRIQQWKSCEETVAKSGSLIRPVPAQTWSKSAASLLSAVRNFFLVARLPSSLGQNFKERRETLSSVSTASYETRRDLIVT